MSVILKQLYSSYVKLPLITPVMVTILAFLVINTGVSSAVFPSHTIQMLSTGSKLDGNSDHVFG